MSARVSTLWLSISILCGVGFLCMQTAVAQPAPATSQPAASQPEIETDDPAITVFLVRHAEKVRGPAVGNDPPLTEAGQARARALAMTLADAGVDAIYTTQWLRTRETGADLAERLQIQAEVVETADGFIHRMRQKILQHEGQTLVVVGHSDTTPELARALGAADAPNIQDNDFDDLYQVTITPTEVRFVHLRFGHPTP